jgi:hypothetical protein
MTNTKSRIDSSFHAAPAATWPRTLAGKALQTYRGWSIQAADSIARFAVDIGADGLLPTLRTTTGDLRDWMLDQHWPVRPLRIAVANPGAWSEPLFEQSSPFPIDWFATDRSTPGAAVCRWNGLDATIEHLGSGGVNISTLERSECPSLWEDWAKARPASFPTIFPLRFDTAGIHCEHVGEHEWPLLHQLLVTASVLSRDPARTNLDDIINGRYCPTAATPRLSLGGTPVQFTPQQEWSLIATSQLGSMLIEQPGAAATPARCAAARLVGACAASGSWQTREHFRLACARAAATVLKNDPTPLLQLAAVQIGATLDEEAVANLARAQNLLRQASADPDVDHIAFLHAEAATGETKPLTTGRLASGLCIAMATVPESRVRFMVEDFVEELTDSGIMIEREQDLALLHKVARSLATHPECFAPAAEAEPSQASASLTLPTVESASQQVAKPKRRSPRRKAA